MRYYKMILSYTFLAVFLEIVALLAIIYCIPVLSMDRVVMGIGGVLLAMSMSLYNIKITKRAIVREEER